MSLILDGASGAPASGPTPSDLIKDGDTATFMADVVEGSRKVPVIVDFWAPWCGPCKQLGPILERQVRQAGGAVRMVKINVDQNQELAMQLRVQSIPAVYAFKDGRVADRFVGALPESQVKEFVARLTGSRVNMVDQALAEAKEMLDSGDAATAAGIYEEILHQDPENPLAMAGLLRCYLALGQAEAAKEILGQLPPELANHAEIKAVMTSIALAEEADSAGDVAPLAARVEADPKDKQARFDLALALYARNKAEEAMDHLLELFRQDRAWNEEAARNQLLKIFEALGPMDERVISARRRLSSMMFA